MDTFDAGGESFHEDVPGPMFSVILNTYNRASLLPRAVRSVLAQTYMDFELIVADDGSTDDTSQVMQGFGDPRVRYVQQTNGGLSAARNFGAACSSGRFLAFLDDDDEVSHHWLQSFATLISASGCAVACCGAEVVGSDGKTTSVQVPHDLGPPFDNNVGLFLAGTFAVRRDVFEGVGGFTEGLSCSHQTELALRVVPWCTEFGLHVASEPTPHLRMHRATATERGRNDPIRLLACSTYILQRHGARLARSSTALANYLSIAGVSAARSGNYPLSRAYLLQASRARPLNFKGHGRVILSLVRPLGDVVWGSVKPGTRADTVETPTEKVFLDVGAHVGETLIGVLDRKYAFDRIYCFEPVAGCQETLSGIGDSRVTVCPFGLSNLEAERKLFNPGDIGASVFADKDPGLQYELCRFVGAADWFRENIREGDRVYMKLNCEGSECDVIDDLIDSGQIRTLEAMAVYWDRRKIPSQAHREHEVRARLEAVGFRRYVDAKVVMRGPTYAARTQRWLDAIGADLESPVLRQARRVRYLWLPRSTLQLRRVLRVVLPARLFRLFQQAWRKYRYHSQN